MIKIIAVAVACAGLVLAAWTFLLVWRDRPISRPLLVGAAVVEALLVAQLVGALVLIGQGERPAEPLTFALYIVGSLLTLPLGAWWALGERSRSGTAVLGVAAVVVSVLVERLEQVWRG